MQWTMEEFRDPADLGEDELLALRAEYASEHRWLCLRRWALFDQIDLMRSERVRRLKEGLVDYGAPAAIAPRSTVRGRAGFSGEGSGDPVDPDDAAPLPALPLVTALDDDSILALLRATQSAEDDVSLRRQIVWARLRSLERELEAGGGDADD